MRLERVSISRLSVPLEGTYAASVHDDLSTMTSVLVVLRTRDGARGIGTADPSPGYSRQVPADIVADLETHVLPRLLEHSPESPNEFRAAMADVAAGPNAIAAAEMAFLDLYGRRHGVAIADLFGGAVNERESLNAWIGIDTPDAMADAAAAWADRGFDSAKLKLSGDPTVDVDRVRTVAERVGDRIELRADVNGAYDVDTAIDVARELSSSPLVHLEQPVSQAKLDELAQVRAVADVPIMADEPVTSVERAFEVLGGDIADRVKLKTLRLGGLLPARNAFAVARAAGVSPVVGHGFCLSPAASAELQLVSTEQNVFRPLECVGPIKMTEEPFDPALSMDGGTVTVPDGPGLGVTLDDDALGKFEAERIDVTR